MNIKVINVLIVGCGNIAGGFDLDYQGNMPPCTHAGAFFNDDRYKIKACVDVDLDKCKLFQKKWNIPFFFSTLEEAAGFLSDIDVVSICSPTQYHSNDIELAIQLNPKLIFCEKPVTLLSSETERIVNICEKNNVLLAVNYNRRWDNKVAQLKEDILIRRYGELRSVVGLYNKGILNNGSHLLDLLMHILGDLEVSDVSSPVYDFFDNDPTISAMFYANKNIPIHLAAGHAGDYAIFEIQFIFSSGLLVMLDGGLQWSYRKIENSERFNGYKVLTKGEVFEGGLKNTMENAVDNIYKSLYGSEKLNSTGTNALEAQKICQKLYGLSIDSDKSTEAYLG